MKRMGICFHAIGEEVAVLVYAARNAFWDLGLEVLKKLAVDLGLAPTTVLWDVVCLLISEILKPVTAEEVDKYRATARRFATANHSAIFDGGGA